MSDGLHLPPAVAKLLFETQFECPCGWRGSWKESAGLDMIHGIVCPQCGGYTWEQNDLPIVVEGNNDHYADPLPG